MKLELHEPYSKTEKKKRLYKKEKLKTIIFQEHKFNKSSTKYWHAEFSTVQKE